MTFIEINKNSQSIKNLLNMIDCVVLCEFSIIINLLLFKLICNMLTEEQQRFLFRYVNNKGDFYKTIETMGIELSHVTSWQQTSKDFADNYKSAKQTVIEHLKQENYMQALLKVNDALVNGVNQYTVTQKHRIGGYDEETGEQQSEYEVTKTHKQLGTPAWAITASLQECSIVKAVHTLASEGVLPSAIARRILQSANKISEEVKASFGIDAGADYINDRKAISLIKQAILGVADE
jgi:hypothetical protein